MKTIDGKLLAAKITEAVRKEIAVLHPQLGRAPKMDIIVVGEDPYSIKYVNSKKKKSEEVGIECDVHLLSAATKQEDLLQLIDQLNNNNLVDAIFVQLPLPKGFDEQQVLEAIDYRKDVDGLHPMNVGLMQRVEDPIIPCTSRGILSLLQEAKVDIAGKHCVVVGRSSLVGYPTAQLMLKMNATVTVCHSQTKNLAQHTKEADILILATGNPRLVTPEMMKPGVVVIDVAINFDNGKMVGDAYHHAHLDELGKVVSAITPVPGGVGPMTVVSLLQNCVDLYKNNNNLEIK